MAAYGGEISLCYLLERFLPRLEAAGFPPGTLADFTVLNWPAGSSPADRYFNTKSVKKGCA